jgi:hypothetical protein
LSDAGADGTASAQTNMSAQSDGGFSCRPSPKENFMTPIAAT